MTVARKSLVDVSLTRYYHCISRCVRGAFLCGAGFEHRKQWIEDRLEVLAAQFAVSVCGFAVMDNHLHVLVRLDPKLSSDWSDEEIVRRWLAVYPPRTLNFDDAACVRMGIANKDRHHRIDFPAGLQYNHRIAPSCSGVFYDRRP